eukprot:350891-Chlamydomonas_euryale.AAC.8
MCAGSLVRTSRAAQWRYWAAPLGRSPLSVDRFECCSACTCLDRHRMHQPRCVVPVLISVHANPLTRLFAETRPCPCAPRAPTPPRILHPVHPPHDPKWPSSPISW